MFTGIVQGVDNVVSIDKKNSEYYEYFVRIPNMFLKGIKIGDSISNNGCCSTIIKIFKNISKFHIIIETFKRITFKYLKKK